MTINALRIFNNRLQFWREDPEAIHHGHWENVPSIETGTSPVVKPHPEPPLSRPVEIGGKAYTHTVDFSNSPAMEQLHTQAAAGGAIDQEGLEKVIPQYDRVVQLERANLNLRIELDAAKKRLDGAGETITTFRVDGTPLKMQSVDEILRRESLETQRKLDEALRIVANVTADRTRLRNELAERNAKFEQALVDRALFRGGVDEAKEILAEVANGVSSPDAIVELRVKAQLWVNKMSGAPEQ